MGLTRLLQVHQRLVRSPEVVEVVPQQKPVWHVASQLGRSPAELEPLLVLADLHEPIASACSGNSRERSSTSRPICIPSRSLPWKVLSYARILRHTISITLL